MCEWMGDRPVRGRTSTTISDCHESASAVSPRSARIVSRISRRRAEVVIDAVFSHVYRPVYVNGFSQRTASAIALRAAGTLLTRLNRGQL